MLRIIETFNHCPNQFKIDPDAVFQPGQIGQLKILQGQIVVNLSDGLSPIGIIDDIKTPKLRSVVWDKTIIVPIYNQELSASEAGVMVSSVDTNVEINKNVIVKSYYSNIPTQLDARKGIITIPKGSLINFCSNPPANPKAMPFPDSIRFTIRYAFNVDAGDLSDSTLGSERITVWCQPMVCETDMYDISQEYGHYTNLYVENGLLTTKIPFYTCKAVGVVLRAPTTENANLKLLFDPECKIPIGGKHA